ncbi:MAG: hypothetical protein ACREE7_00315, partial [Dongiaceae bacterium]
VMQIVKFACGSLLAGVLGVCLLPATSAAADDESLQAEWFGDSPLLSGAELDGIGAGIGLEPPYLSLPLDLSGAAGLAGASVPDVGKGVGSSLGNFSMSPSSGGSLVPGGAAAGIGEEIGPGLTGSGAGAGVGPGLSGVGGGAGVNMGAGVNRGVGI